MKMMEKSAMPNLSDIPLFRGIDTAELDALLPCLGAIERQYKKGDIILKEGVPTEHLGIILSGLAIIERSDVWGNNSILGYAATNAVFAETYACLPKEPLRIRVTAAEDTTVLLLNVSRVLHTCQNVCGFHTKLIRNLLTVSAEKNLQLSDRILYTTSKSIRGRLLSYFSDQVKRNGSFEFSIPLNRQQLADYLSVDRSAMSNELSKMQKEGLLRYRKNRFTVHAHALEE